MTLLRDQPQGDMSSSGVGTSRIQIERVITEGEAWAMPVIFYTMGESRYYTASTVNLVVIVLHTRQ